MEILTFSSSRFVSTSGVPSTSRSVSNLSLFPCSANPSPIRGRNDGCLRWASRKICTNGRWGERESALCAKYRRTSYFAEAEEDKRRGMVGDEECPWEGAIMYKRSASHTHLEYCTSLESLGLASLSSQLSISTASQMGFRVTGNGDSGTPVQISIDVTRKRRDLQLDGLLRTFITLPCYRCGEAAAKLVFSNFCLLLREDPIDEADEMDTTVGFGKDKAKTAYVSFDEEDHEEELDLDLDDQMYFPREEKEIDISKYIRDIVHLENSMTALCDLNCKGSCLNCGTNLNKVNSQNQQRGIWWRRMDFELKAAKEKLEREQRERKERARIQIERERKAREEARRRQEALEAHQQARRIEAAQAALAASQKEEEDLIVGNGVRFNIVFHAIPYQGSGDKIKLPPSSFDELSAMGALDKGPMYFELSTVNEQGTSGSKKQETTHSGVLEFTASEGFAELPPQVWQNLFPINSQNPLIRIRYVRLPKGTYAKLQPEGLGFSDIPNHRAVLETTLRQHATLSEGDLLIVHHGGMEYRLRVLELKPASSISVLETDIEVDITEPSMVASSMAQGALIPLVLGKSEIGVVEEGKYNYYKFLIDSKSATAAANGEMNIIVKLLIDNNGTNGDADLYISRHPLLFPTQHQHQWSSHDLGTKVVSLTGRGLDLAADTYSIGVFGFRGTSKYKIIVECLPSIQSGAMGQKLGNVTAAKSGFNLASSSQESVDSEQCQNCKQFIPARTIALHEAYCRRHNIVCQYKGCGVILRKEEAEKHVHCLKCGRAFHQEEMEKHMKVFHEPLHCGCGEVLEKEEMVVHQSSVCPLRVITCRFCGDMVQAGNAPDDARDRIRGYSQHESLCGSRTAPCDSCGRAVMLKEMDIHKIAVHEKLGSESDNSTAKILITESDSAGVVHHSAPQTSTFQTQISHSTQSPNVKSLACPICNQIFSGSDSDWQLNVHLDKDHLSKDIANDNNLINTPLMSDGSLHAEDKTLRTMLVSCPICGINVHSERDLSQHIDLVH